MIVIALITAVVWIYLLTARGDFWRALDFDTSVIESPNNTWPSVIAVVPARNEAGVVAHSLRSILVQDYRGSFGVILVDDNSDDGTSEVAQWAAIGVNREDCLSVIRGRHLPKGWTGKLWALNQGVEAASQTEPTYYWFSDADIVYTPDTLRTMVLRADKNNLSAVSLMARLRCQSFAERMLIPAFIFFFQMLYPFRWVNQAGSRTAAAAGGCILVRRAALADIGGLMAIRDALIDDCTLAAHLKRNTGRIWIGLTHRAESIRAYDRLNDIRRMVARSAYAQLRYSPTLLLCTLVGMVIVYVTPPAVALASTPPARYVAIFAWTAMALAFVPTLRFYKASWLWSALLPVIALCYAAFTLDSAAQHVAGRGGLWKGRVQAPRDV
ncbi:glycosyltransferase [Microvirga terricola]|uniref:Glycosyltransferase n=1 Tax=Microvirga terricola TaxID=2719797 RepID=A0ABX0VEG8_9HYPH|nr:glycosyltransferase [Microvirga terricola]NIX78234.1 glycosyltransferase [Microvirga terricola]